MKLPADSIEHRIAHAAAEAVLDKLLPILAPLLEPQPVPLPPPQTPRDGDLDAKVFLTVSEAAALLGVHKDTLLRYEQQDRLPARSALGGKTGWHRQEIDAFLASLPRRPKLRQGRRSGAH